MKATTDGGINCRNKTGSPGGQTRDQSRDNDAKTLL